MPLNRPQSAEFQRLLGQAELDAEKLVALLRIGVAIALGVSLFVLVIPVDSMVAQLVLVRQWIFAMTTIVSYFVLGIVTWVMAHRGWFRNWMIWPAAAADVLFVLLSLWLSLKNTGLSGAGLFLLPSAWLVPLVLIFAMLRVNLRVMIFVVAILMVGLLGLYTVEPHGDGQGIQARLMLSDPPNVMRLMMVCIAGVLMGVGVYRARNLLQQSIDATQSAANLTRYLPEQLAPRLAQGALSELRRGRRHMAGILFIDIRGFTHWAETQSSADVTRMITDYRERISRVASDCGGILDKFMGDAAMIVFDDDTDGAAAACVRCATLLSQEMRALSRDRVAQGDSAVRVGIGAHWGEVFSGVVGDKGRLEFSVFGDTVNIAARLEEATRDLGSEIVLSEALVTEAGCKNDWSALASLAIRGREGRVPVVGLFTEPRAVPCVGFE